MRQRRRNIMGFGRSFRRMLAGAAGITMALLIGSMPAMAEVLTIDPKDTGGEIHLVLDYKENDVDKPMDGGQAVLYQVADVYVDNGYHFSLTEKFQKSGNETIEGLPAKTSKELNDGNWDAAMALKKYVEDGGIKPDGGPVTIAGGVTFTGLTPGLYFIYQSEPLQKTVDKKDATIEFTPFIMTIPFTGDDGRAAFLYNGAPKTGISLKTETEPETKETPPESSSNPPESSSNPPESSSNPPESSSNPPESSSNPPESSSNPPESSTTPPPGGGGNPPGSGRDNPPGRTAPPSGGTETPPPTDSSVLGAVRDNGERVLGALRNPGQVLGAVRTGDPSAIFICGEILVLASLMLIGWISVFKKLRRRA